MTSDRAATSSPRAAASARAVLRRVRRITRRLDGHHSVRAWFFAALRSFAVFFLAMTVTLWLLPGEQVSRGALSVAGVAVAVLVVGALLRPSIVWLTSMTGVVGVLLAGLLSQALVLGVALAVVPTVERFTFGEIFVAAWAATAVATLVNWLFDASSEEVFLGQVLGQAIRTASRSRATGPGLLVVQLDGVSEPLLRQALTSGAMPAVARMLRSGSHQLSRWYTGVPATTPAGQAVLMYGDNTSIPGFRWYDKDRARLFSASRAADATEVERQLSNGRGLLADGGASVSNLFSGDAPIRTLTVSDARVPTKDRGAVSYVVGRSGLVRSIVLFVGQLVAEWFQGRRQRRRDVQPRVPRTGKFLLLRGLTTVILRDLNVSVVAQQMAHGTPVIYVDFVDYDEVAHHAGPSRPEAIRTLEHLDRVIEFFADLNAEVGRDYEIALVSDHGQAQGQTFLQLNGETLEQVVQRLTTLPHEAERRTEEPWLPAALLVSGVGRKTPLAGAARRLVAPADRVRTERPIVIAVGGSLAHVYLTRLPGRATLADIESRHPRLPELLAAEPGIGLVLAREAPGRLRVHGPDGWRSFDANGDLDGAGADPVAPYGEHARLDLLELDRKCHVGDLVLLGAFDPALGEVAAFEELVGSHGGLGGWQTRALLIHANWDLPTDRVLSGIETHEALVGRLRTLGLRTRDDTTAAAR